MRFNYLHQSSLVDKGNKGNISPLAPFCVQQKLVVSGVEINDGRTGISNKTYAEESRERRREEREGEEQREMDNNE